MGFFHLTPLYRFLFYRVFVHIPKVHILTEFLFPLIFRWGHHMCLTETANLRVTIFYYTLKPLVLWGLGFGACTVVVFTMINGQLFFMEVDLYLHVNLMDALWYGIICRPSMTTASYCHII